MVEKKSRFSRFTSLFRRKPEKKAYISQPISRTAVIKPKPTFRARITGFFKREPEVTYKTERQLKYQTLKETELKQPEILSRQDVFRIRKEFDERQLKREIERKPSITELITQKPIEDKRTLIEKIQELPPEDRRTLVEKITQISEEERQIEERKQFEYPYHYTAKVHNEMMGWKSFGFTSPNYYDIHNPTDRHIIFQELIKAYESELSDEEFETEKYYFQFRDIKELYIKGVGGIRDNWKGTHEYNPVTMG